MLNSKPQESKISEKKYFEISERDAEKLYIAIKSFLISRQLLSFERAVENSYIFDELNQEEKEIMQSKLKKLKIEEYDLFWGIFAKAKWQLAREGVDNDGQKYKIISCAQPVLAVAKDMIFKIQTD